MGELVMQAEEPSSDGLSSITFASGEHLRVQRVEQTLRSVANFCASKMSRKSLRSVPDSMAAAISDRENKVREAAEKRQAALCAQAERAAEIVASCGPFFAVRVESVVSRGDRFGWLVVGRDERVALGSGDDDDASVPYASLAGDPSWWRHVDIVSVQPELEPKHREKAIKLYSVHGTLASLREEAVLAAANGGSVAAESEKALRGARREAKRRDADALKALRDRFPKDDAISRAMLGEALPVSATDRFLMINASLVVRTVERYVMSAERPAKAIIFLQIKGRSTEQVRDEIYAAVMRQLVEGRRLLAAAEHERARQDAAAASGGLAQAGASIARATIHKDVLSVDVAADRLRRAWELFAAIAGSWLPSPAMLPFVVCLLHSTLRSRTPSASALEQLAELPAADVDLDEHSRFFADDNESAIASLVHDLSAFTDGLDASDDDDNDDDDDDASTTRTETDRSSAPLVAGSSSLLYQDLQEDADSDAMQVRMARFIARRLRRVLANGSRRSALGPSELQATLRCMHSVVRVNALDGTCVTMAVDASTTVRELTVALIDQLGMSESRGWSLYEEFWMFDGFVERSLLKDDKVLDEVWKMEVLPGDASETPVDLDRAAASGAGSSAASSSSAPAAPIVGTEAGAVDALGAAPSFLESAQHRSMLLFKRQLHLQPHTLPIDDPLELELLAYQARADFLAGRVPCDETTTVRLGARLLHYNRLRALGDAEALRVTRCLPATLLNGSLRGDAEWRRDLERACDALKPTSADADAALIEFLQSIKELPLFGTTMFRVSHRSDWNMPSSVYLGVSVTGVSIINIDSGHVYFHRPIADIVYSTQRLKITIFFMGGAAAGRRLNAKGNNSIVLYTREGVEFDTLLTQYRTWLRLYSTTARAKQNHPQGGDGDGGDDDNDNNGDDDDESDDAMRSRGVSLREFARAADVGVLEFKIDEIIEIVDRRSRDFWIGSNSVGTVGAFRMDAIIVLIAVPGSHDDDDDDDDGGGGGGVQNGWNMPPTPRSSRSSRASSSQRKASRFRTQLLSGSADAAASDAFRLRAFADQHFRKAPPPLAAVAPSGAEPAKKRLSKLFRRRSSSTGDVVAPAAAAEPPQMEPYDLDARCRYSAEPLANSLLAIDDAATDAKAVAMSERLRKFVCAPSEAAASESRGQLQRAIEVAVRSGQSVLLAELYCLLIRQTSGNDDVPSLLRAWQTLTLLIACRMPPEELRRYLIAHIQHSLGHDNADVRRWVALAQLRVGRALHRGARSHAPSLLEMELVLAGNAAERGAAGESAAYLQTAGEFTVDVALTDGTVHKVPVDSSCTVSEVIEQLCRIVRYTPALPDAWTLFHRCSRLDYEQALRDSQFVGDCLYVAEHYRLPKKWRGDRPAFSFAYRQRLYFNRPEVPKFINSSSVVDDDDGQESEPRRSELYMVYWGAIDDVLRSRLIVPSRQQLMDLAGAHMRVTKTTRLDEQNIERYVPARDVPALPIAQWVAGVSAARDGLDGRSRSEAMTHALSAIVVLPLYGALIWPVSRQTAQDTRQDVVLGINGIGVHVVKRVTREPIVAFTFGKLRKWQASRNGALVLAVANSSGTTTRRTFYPKTPDLAHAMVAMLDLYVEFLLNRAQELRAERELETQLSLSASSIRGQRKKQQRATAASSSTTKKKKRRVVEHH
jgi:MyTH4 domain/RA like domain/FERM central domain